MQKSCQRAGWVGGFEGYPKNPKTPKNFIKCLIFNGLVFWGGFGAALGWLCGVLKLLDFQRFAKHQASACPTMLLSILRCWAEWVNGRVLCKG